MNNKWTVQREMPRYKCHKEVWALKIATIERHNENDPASLNADRIRTIATDDSGAVWIGSRGLGLTRLDPSTGEIRVYSHDPEDPNSLSHNDI